MIARRCQRTPSVRQFARAAIKRLDYRKDKTMQRFLMVLTMVLAGMAHGAALAQTPVDYRTALKACGVEWRASESRKTVEKGQGMVAWQTFRKECIAKSGYVSKRNRG